MEASSVMCELEKAGNSNTATIYRKHGVVEDTFGVPYAALAKLVKRIGTDHPLAVELWATGNHDARVLATKIASPEHATAAVLSTWLKACTNYVINDAISALAARRPDAETIAAKWAERTDEWVAAAGWNVFAALATEARLAPDPARQLIGRIQKKIHGAKNRARHAMNNALIAIGGSIDELTEEALAAAETIGPVEVDHGTTGCKTPDAKAYIAKMVQRKSAKRPRIAEARTKAPSSRNGQRAQRAKRPRTPQRGR